MKILVNGREALIKSGTSIEYVQENRFFTESDDYTLNITFPIAGCPQNIKIFGNRNRVDLTSVTNAYDCEITDINFHKVGVIVLTDISETELKFQFLAGRSASNYRSDWGEEYINEINLGAPYSPVASLYTPAQVWAASFGRANGYVALPWVNNTSGNIQNKPNADYNGWDDDTTKLSFQPYLLHITKKICEHIGYTYDFSEWEASNDLKYLLICNALPAAWELPAFHCALPHWTIKEYFNKLESFMAMQFDIDHEKKHITCKLNKTILTGMPILKLDRVERAYSVTVDDDEEVKYVENRVRKYKDAGHNMSKYYSCDWLIEQERKLGNVIEYDTLDELIIGVGRFIRGRTVRFVAKIGHEIVFEFQGYAYPSKDGIDNKILYARDFDGYYIVKVTGKTKISGTNYWSQDWTLVEINRFGASKYPTEDTDVEEELEFVPAWEDETDDGTCLFLEAGSMSDDGDTVIEDSERDKKAKKEEELMQPRAASLLQEEDEPDDAAPEYYDCIYLAFWDSDWNGKKQLPCPAISWITMPPGNPTPLSGNNPYTINQFDQLKLKTGQKPIYEIVKGEKYNIKFLSKTMPDVRSVFVINGQKYLCEKLTATLTERGMSEMIKGVFWKLK